MTTKQELKDRLAARTAEVVELRREVNWLNRELTDARAQLDARQADAPGPRSFRVGDRVRVAEGATWHSLLRTVPPIKSPAAGYEGVVTDMASDGDLYVEWARPGIGGVWVSPEFCTLIEVDEPTAAPDPTTPAPSVRVRVVYESGSLSQDFDADGIAVMEAAPVYALLKDGDVVACVPVAGVRSVEVVR